MRRRIACVLVSLVGTSVLVAGGLLATTGAGVAGAGQWSRTLHVGCGGNSYTTVSAAVAAAKPWSTVVVCAGTYDEDVVIQSPLTLIGKSGATINATGLSGAPIGSILGQAPYNGITIESSNVKVKGFIVEGAQGEGILAVNPDPVPVTVAGMSLFTGTPLTHITIEDNDVTGNDLGFNLATSPYASCTPNGGSDCGEGIHLMSVADSQVINNQSVDNAGGILLTDEFGPNHDNLVANNLVEGNTKDCGITVPGHNLGVNPATGAVDPTFGGDYRNRIIHNTVIGNGVAGYGAGVGIFAPGSYTASYDNIVSGNYIEGNGLAGISVHSHAPNAYVNGNVFTNNVIGTNNVDLADGTGTTPIDNETTGILIWSDATPYDFVVAHNKIFGNTYGIWYTPSTVTAFGLKTNHIFGATTNIYDAP